MFLDRYQCGPSPVEAVKRGDVGVGFDSAFVFAEVNADVFVYVVDKKSEWGFKLAQTNTTQWVSSILLNYQVNIIELSEYNSRQFRILSIEKILFFTALVELW